LKKNKLPNNLKNIILKPTKIYSKEIINLSNKNLINSAAHITGGGLIENLLRSVPKNLTLNIDLSKIKITKIFKWLKTKNISDHEMMKTFNCGIGFCLIVNKKNVVNIKKVFSNEFKPYEIGFISKENSKLKLSRSLKW
jgi:phosphoribosylaminoimidazole (AIR) synthetase